MIYSTSFRFPYVYPKMSEQFLNRLHVDELIDLMTKCTEELLEINKFSYNRRAVESKYEEVELLQKVIVGKREGSRVG